MSSELPAFEVHPVDVPPGYPREYERLLRLSDGRAVQVRPIIPGDQVRLREAFESADAETLYRRFLSNPPHLTAERLAYWCTVDYQRRFALVACAAGTGESVAVARYEPVEEGVADVAVVVDPRWRRIGVATALIEMLAQAALDRDVHSFGASYLVENRPVAALTGLAGGVRNPRVWRGVAEVAVELDREKVSAAIQAGTDVVARTSASSSAVTASSAGDLARSRGLADVPAPTCPSTGLHDDVFDGGTECACLTSVSGPTHVMLGGVANRETVDVLRDALAMAANIRPHEPVVIDLDGLERVTPDALAEIDRIVAEAVRAGVRIAPCPGWPKGQALNRQRLESPPACG